MSSDGRRGRGKAGGAGQQLCGVMASNPAPEPSCPSRALTQGAVSLVAADLPPCALGALCNWWVATAQGQGSAARHTHTQPKEGNRTQVAKR